MRTSDCQHGSMWCMTHADTRKLMCREPAWRCSTAASMWTWRPLSSGSAHRGRPHPILMSASLPVSQLCLQTVCCAHQAL